VKPRGSLLPGLVWVLETWNSIVAFSRTVKYRKKAAGPEKVWKSVRLKSKI